MPLVFIDASSAILLYKTDLFVQCAEVYSLVAAESVYKEIAVKSYPGADFFRKMVLKDRIKILSFDNSKKATLNIPAMDTGEKHTIALFYQHFESDPSSFIIMDDKKGAMFCYNNSFPFINALLVPKVLWYAGLMKKDAYIKKRDLVIKQGRYSGKIIEKAKGLAEKDLSHFIPYEH